MRVNHYCKNRMDYRFKTNLAGNTPAFMCAVLNSERAALCLEGRGNKSKSSLRRDSPSVVWVASDARLKCCKVQREQSFVSRGVYLEGRENVTATSTFNHKKNHKRRKASVACHVSRYAIWLRNGLRQLMLHVPTVFRCGLNIQKGFISWKL